MVKVFLHVTDRHYRIRLVGKSGLEGWIQGDEFTEVSGQ